MVYIHVKKVGEKRYYTLRVAVRRKGKVLTKDLANLGSDLSKVNLAELEKKYKVYIRKSHKALRRFLEENHYLALIRRKKLKQSHFFTSEQLEQIEAIHLHSQKVFRKLDFRTQQDIYQLFLIKFAVSSTSIEGNTINLAQASKLLMDNTIPAHKTMREIYDLQNTHRVFFKLLQEKPELSLEMIAQVHDELLDQTDVRKGYRTHDIHILHQPFKPSPGIYVRADMKLLLEWYHKQKQQMHPLALAIFFHHKLENIHPFSDGNGRTGRVLLNHILLRQGYPPLLVPVKFREEYLAALSNADRALKTSVLSTSRPPYQALFSFLVQQYTSTYWNTFLA